jgi:hypothetical protein
LIFSWFLSVTLGKWRIAPRLGHERLLSDVSHFNIQYHNLTQYSIACMCVYIYILSFIVLNATFIVLVLSETRGSSVGITTGYGLGGWRFGVWFSVESRFFSSPQRLHLLWDPPRLLSNGY